MKKCLSLLFCPSSDVIRDFTQEKKVVATKEAPQLSARILRRSKRVDSFSPLGKSPSIPLQASLLRGT